MDLPQRQRFDPFVHRIAVSPRIHHPYAFEPKVLQSDMHGLGDRRGIGALELKPPPTPSAHKQEIQFGPPLRAPVVAVALAGQG
jgi:hypothetical protein